MKICTCGYTHVLLSLVNGLLQFILRQCRHDNGYMVVRSQIKFDSDERIQSAQFSLVVTHPSTNRARRYLTSVNEPPSPSKHWSPPRTSVRMRTFVYNVHTCAHYVVYDVP